MRFLVALFAILLLGGDLATEVARAAPTGDGIGVAGRRLHLRIRRGFVERMSYISGDARLPFPELGSADDPRTAGVDVEIFTGGGQSSSFRIRPGEYEGMIWKTRSAKLDAYKYKNRLAPAGHSFVKKLQVKEGQLLRIASRRHNIDLRTPQTSVIVRVTMGEQQSCTQFIEPALDGIIPGRDADSTSFFSRVGIAPPDCRDETIESLLGVTFD